VRENPVDSEMESSGEDFKRHLGTLLIQARNERKIGLIKAVTDLKLNREYLQGLESGDWSALPGKFYARGFLIQYARYLGVDIKDELAILKTSDYRLTSPHTFPDPPIAPKRFWAVASGISFLLLLLIFNIFLSHDEARTPAMDKPATSTEPSPDDIRVNHKDVSKGMARANTKRTSPTDSRENAKTEKVSPVLHQYSFKANKLQVLLRVFDRNKKRISTFLLKPGETARLKQKGFIYISAGRAGALAISVDGKVVAPAGSLGELGSEVRMVKVRSDSV